MNIAAKDFTNRQELELKIRLLDVKKHKTAVIIGTKEELARLHLSDRTTIDGIPCKVTNTPGRKRKTLQRPERGRKFPYGINLPVK